MYKKKIKIIIILLLLFCFTSLGTFALINRSTTPLLNIFRIPTPEITINEEFDSETKDKISIENTGTADVFVRVKLVSHFISTDCPKTDTKEQCQIIPIPDSLNVAYNKKDWIKINDHYYYRTVLSKESETTNLLEEPIKNRNLKDYYFKVDVLAQSIQSEPETIVEEAWHVDIDKGTIIGVKQ